MLFRSLKLVRKTLDHGYGLVLIARQQTIGKGWLMRLSKHANKVEADVFSFQGEEAMHGYLQMVVYHSHSHCILNLIQILVNAFPLFSILLHLLLLMLLDAWMAMR